MVWNHWPSSGYRPGNSSHNKPGPPEAHYFVNLQNRTKFISLPIGTQTQYSAKKWYNIRSNRQSRRDQWSSSQVTAREERQLPRTHAQQPQTKRPPHHNLFFNDSIEKNEYDTKNLTATHIEITRPAITGLVEGSGVGLLEYCTRTRNLFLKRKLLVLETFILGKYLYLNLKVLGLGLKISVK